MTYRTGCSGRWADGRTAASRFGPRTTHGRRFPAPQEPTMIAKRALLVALALALLGGSFGCGRRHLCRDNCASYAPPCDRACP